MSEYNRILIKLSGEALKGETGFGIDPKTVNAIAAQVKDVHNTGVQVAIVVGGGNIWRGKTAEELGMDRSTADYMGMMATMMNGLALQDSLEMIDVPTRVMTALEMNQIAEPYIRRRAIRHLEKKRVVIFVGGTGSPYFSTDTGSALRAAEIKADAILMAKNGTDGVYDKDPQKHTDAVMFDNLTHFDLVEKQLQVMDLTASTMCRDNDIPVVVFNLNKEGNILKVVNGDKIGTLITN
jgi:uridylate kinase